MDTINNRNASLDCAKGIAIILVCIGHILQSCTSDFSQTAVYNFIFLIQMPAFFVISGILSNRRDIMTFYGLMRRIGIKAMAYLIPFFSRIIIFNSIFNMKKDGVVAQLMTVIRNVDSGLWYLWVLFVLCVGLDIATYISLKIKKKYFSYCIEMLLFGLFLIPWVAEIVCLGTGYLGARLILFYSVFYYGGRLIKRVSKKTIDKYREIVCLLSLLIGCFIAFNCYLFDAADNLYNIIVRVIAGITLTILLLHICEKFSNKLKAIRMDFIGRNSLEIYYVHGIAFSLISDVKVSTYSVMGIATILASIFITTLYTVILITIIKSNRGANFIFFGKGIMIKRYVENDKKSSN